jgi:hypothetical protein
VGILSLAVLLLAILARYVLRLDGAGRWIYAVNLVLGVYFLAFVAVAQLFQKVPALATLGQTAFAAAEALLLILALLLCLKSARSFRPRPSLPAT